MPSRTAAIIGTGNPEEGAGIAYYHADAYDGLDECDLVACADVVPERASAFAADYDFPEENVYTEYERMLKEVRPDVVSVAVPPGLHAKLVVGAARTGIPEAIHCEKPMARTWGESRRMARECWRRGVQLTFNHQRRFSGAWQQAKTRLEAGAIGELRRVETGPPNFFDWGTHAVDLCNFFAGDSPAEWVIGNLDYREERRIFDVHHEDQLLASWQYANGVHGLASTGPGSDAVSAFTRLVGDEGSIEVDIDGRFGARYDVQAGGAGIGEHHSLRICPAGETEPKTLRYEEGWTEMIRRGIADLLTALDDGHEPELSSSAALGGTEILFGAYESARRRGRVDFPLEIDDHPLEAMVADGTVDPSRTDE